MTWAGARSSRLVSFTSVFPSKSYKPLYRGTHDASELLSVLRLCPRNLRSKIVTYYFLKVKEKMKKALDFWSRASGVEKWEILGIKRDSRNLAMANKEMSNNHSIGSK